MGRLLSKTFLFLVLTSGLVFLSSWVSASNLPVWGGSTTISQPLLQQPGNPLNPEPFISSALAVQSAEPRLWRSAEIKAATPILTPNTTPITTPVTTPTRPTVLTPAGQLQPQPAGVVNTGVQWAQWSDLAWEATKTAVNTNWTLQATVNNVRINGPNATGPPGCLQGPDLAPIIRTHMVTNNAPPEVANVFADSIGEAWKAWQDHVTIPGLAWYPDFAVWAGPQAPPTPNIPTPLIALVSSGTSQITSQQQMTARITAKLNAAGLASPEAISQVQRFSGQLSMSFQTWLSSTQVRSVLGQGPVPSFAPPYVPAGPVVGGTVISAPGIINGNLR